MNKENGWEHIEIGKHLKLLSGFPFPSNKFSSEDGVPLIRIRDVVGSKIETYYQGIVLQPYVIKYGDILIGMDGDFNVAKWRNQDALLNQRVLKVDVDDSGKLDINLIFYWIQPFIRKINEITAATTVKHLSTKDIINAKGRLPNLKTQKKIAHILQTIDEAIEKTEALIEKYQQIKAGLMHDLFTRGIDANGQLRPPREQAPELYQQTPIGWIPKEWQYELLDKLAVRGSGHTPSKSHPDYWNGGIKWISLADSHRLDQLYISDTEYEISAQGVQNSSAVVHPAGIVVLSRDAGIGKSAITTEPMAVSQHFMCWRCEGTLDNYFLYYWLQHNKRLFENIAMGSTILTIGLAYFKRLKVNCPISKDEQINISSKLKSIDDTLVRYSLEAGKLRSKKSGLMNDLLTGKVSVKVEEEIQPVAEACA